MFYLKNNKFIIYFVWKEKATFKLKVAYVYKLKKIINVTHNNAEYSKQLASDLKKELRKRGFFVPKSFDPNANLIICVGGDGAFLHTLHKFSLPKIPIVGINTGHLGFFQEIHPHNIESFLDLYENNDFSIQKIVPLEGSIFSCEHENIIKKVFGINEIVIKSNKSRTIHLEISVNSNLIQKFSGDGIIISTPSGSTAYNYSARGSIVDPSLNIIQITPLSPINTNAYRCFTSSIILPSNSKIKISSESKYEDSILIVADGLEYQIKSISEIEIKYSNLELQFLRLKNYEFWSKVTEKFLK